MQNMLIEEKCESHTTTGNTMEWMQTSYITTVCNTRQSEQCINKISQTINSKLGSLKGLPRNDSCATYQLVKNWALTISYVETNESL